MAMTPGARAILGQTVTTYARATFQSRIILAVMDKRRRRLDLTRTGRMSGRGRTHRFDRGAERPESAHPRRCRALRRPSVHELICRP
jgi:hypothetical protein